MDGQRSLNFASLRNKLYQTFLRDKPVASKLKYNRIRNKIQKLVKKETLFQENLVPTQKNKGSLRLFEASLGQFVKLRETQCPPWASTRARSICSKVLLC